MFKLALVVSAALALSAAQAGTYFDKLNSTQQDQVLTQGKQLVISKDASGPWPELTIYQWTGSAPEQVCGVFADFDIQKDYIADMTKSTARKVSQNTYEVEYVIKVPILSDEVYSMNDVLTSYDNGSGYKITWNLVKATRTKTSTGYFACEPVSGGTFIAYNNYVDPGINGFVARRLYDTAMAKVKDTPYTILKQLKKELTSNPAQLDKQIELLKAAVAK